LAERSYRVSISIRRLTQLSMFLALGYLGSLLRIPTPVGSTAFDSAPAYFAGLFLGGPAGALVGCLAHLFTALVSGFPYSLPVHLVVALGMGGSVFAFSWLWRRSRPLGVLAGLLCNGVLLPLCLLCWPIYSWQAVVFGLMPGLLLATALNLLVTVVLWTVWGSRHGRTS
jgi:uncharacterized membrane protein